MLPDGCTNSTRQQAEPVPRILLMALHISDSEFLHCCVHFTLKGRARRRQLGRDLFAYACACGDHGADCSNLSRVLLYMACWPRQLLPETRDLRWSTFGGLFPPAHPETLGVQVAGPESATRWQRAQKTSPYKGVGLQRPCCKEMNSTVLNWPERRIEQQARQHAESHSQGKDRQEQLSQRTAPALRGRAAQLTLYGGASQACVSSQRRILSAGDA
jgi:hypothetical protein